MQKWRWIVCIEMFTGKHTDEPDRAASHLGFYFASGRWGKSSLLALLVGKSPLAEKRPKIRFYSHQQLLILSVSSTKWIQSGKEIPLSPPPHNPLIFVILRAHSTKQPPIPPPTNKTCKDFCHLSKATYRKPIGYVWRPPQAWRNSPTIWNQCSYP